MAIALDGGLTDWTSADRLDLSGGGVAGYGLYGRYEAGNFVFAISAPAAIGANTTLWLNTDRSKATGFQVFGFAAGAEYNINFDANGIPVSIQGLMVRPWLRGQPSIMLSMRQNRSSSYRSLQVALAIRQRLISTSTSTTAFSCPHPTTLSPIRCQLQRPRRLRLSSAPRQSTAAWPTGQQHLVSTGRRPWQAMRSTGRPPVTPTSSRSRHRPARRLGPTPRSG